MKSMKRGGYLAVFASLVLVGTTAHAADPINGNKLYGQHCASCHGDHGVPTMPGIPDFSRGERLMQTDLALVKEINAGQGMMPAFQGLLSENEMLDIIAYLRTLR